MSIREELLAIYQAAVTAASAPAVLPDKLPTSEPSGRTIVLGCGKAAAAMAEVAAKKLAGEVVGCVVTRFGHGASEPTGTIKVIEASHPVPDSTSLAAGRQMRELAEGARAGDRVIFLISGGGSSLLVDPIAGLSLERKAAINRHLVKSGVPIADINLVRRHLSRVKGGRLASFACAAADDMHSFVISDVVGNDPAVVASGPSIASPFEPARAITILEGSGWPLDSQLRDMIWASEPVTAPIHPVHVVADAFTALEAATHSALANGWNVTRIGDNLTGEAASIGRQHAELAMRFVGSGERLILVSGGELTVKVKCPDGRGGPNLEYLTGLMAALPASAPVAALACDSDGIDGSEDNAGGYFDMTMRPDASECEAALSSNRTYDLFERLGGLVVTGPTRTNVNDIRIVAVGVSR